MDGLGFGSRQGAGDFFSVLQNLQIVSVWCALSLLFGVYRYSLPSVERPERHIDHSPPFSAEVRDEWDSAPPPCRRGVDGETSALLLLKVSYTTLSTSRAVPYTGGTYLSKGRDSSVGIATRYWLGGLGIESRWGRDFLHPSRPALGPTQPPIQWVPPLSRG
jgi:hypothetical protein